MDAVVLTSVAVKLLVLVVRLDEVLGDGARFDDGTAIGRDELRSFA